MDEIQRLQAALEALTRQAKAERELREASDRRAEEERQRREEEQRRREEAERRREEEQRRREEEQRRREEAEAAAKPSKPTDVIGYLSACHELQKALVVVTDPTWTTQGETTKPVGRLYPPRILPWKDFARTQQRVWSLMSSSDGFSRRLCFPSQHQLEYAKSSLSPVSDEMGLRHFEREAVDIAVQKLIDEVYNDEKLRGLLGLRGTVTFQSHTNLGTSTSKPLEQSVQNLSITDEADAQHPVVNRRQRRRGPAYHSDKDAAALPTPVLPRTGGQADQFCIYRTADGDAAPAVAIEYKAPHKLSKDQIWVGLRSEIDIKQDVIDKHEDTFEFTCKWLAAAVITQLFSYMVAKGLRYGYVCTGEALVFIHVPEDLSAVYQYTCVPTLDVQGQGEDWLQHTAVAQVFAFIINALAADPPAQTWYDRAARLKQWEVEYVDILLQIPETTRKQRRPSAYRAPRWEKDARSPIVTRSRTRRQQNTDNGSDDEISTDENTMATSPSQQRLVRRARRRCKPSESAMAGESDDSNHGRRDNTTRTQRLGSKTTAPEVTASARRTRESARKDPQTPEARKRERVSSVKEAPYCSHKCLRGVAFSEAVDEQCPNFEHHPRERINPVALRRLLREQLYTDRGKDADCQPLHLRGSSGALFKVRLSIYGYVFVVKGVEASTYSLLHQEHKVYQHLQALQGVVIPTCLGIIDLRLPQYYDEGRYTRMLLLSWAGEPVWKHVNLGSSLQVKINAAVTALHASSVLHGDIALRNFVYNSSSQQVMVVDFERSQIIERAPLQPLQANSGGKQKRRGKGDGPGEFARELQSVQVLIA